MLYCSLRFKHKWWIVLQEEFPIWEKKVMMITQSVTLWPPNLQASVAFSNRRSQAMREKILRPAVTWYVIVWGWWCDGESDKLDGRRRRSFSYLDLVYLKVSSVFCPHTSCWTQTVLSHQYYEQINWLSFSPSHIRPIWAQPHHRDTSGDMLLWSYLYMSGLFPSLRVVKLECLLTDAVNQ